MTLKAAQNHQVNSDGTSLSEADPQVQIEDALCFNLYTASRLMTQAYSEHLKKINLTYPQFLVMNLLWLKNKVTLKYIGERMYLDSGTLTPMINRLVDLGFIKKEKSSRDEREIYIVLTSKGKNLKKKSADIPMTMFCKLDVSVERFVEIRDGVNEILGKLKIQVRK